MKIIITGAHGVGKTTLANILSKELKIKLLPEVARQMIKKGLMKNGITLEFEQEMLRRQVLLEMDNYFIADRGILDIMAYTSVIFSDNELASELLNDINNSYCAANYDIIFYLPPEFPIEDDGLRSTDVKLQKQIDQKIRDILSVNTYKWYTLTGSVEERKNQALKHLTSIK